MPTYISALTLNGVPQIDLRQDTIDENTATEGATGHKNDGSPFTGEITTRTASDLTASGATVTIPAGIYSTQATKSVATTTHPDPTVSISSSTGLITASHTQTAGYVSAGTTTDTLQLTTQAAATITPSTSQQTAVAAGKYTTGNVVVAAMPSGTAGTPTATKGTVNNHSISITPSVTNTTGYITGSTKTGTAVTVSASELVSGSETKTANGTYDVTNLASLVVNVAASGANFATATTNNSNNQAQSISFTLTAGRTVKACFVRLTSQVARSSSYRYYYVFDLRWDGSSTGGVAGNTFYMYSGTLSNVTSGYSHSQDGTTFTLSTTGTRSTSPGSFYNGTYELVYAY